MFNKISSFKLLIGFAVLIAIYFGITFLNQNSKSSLLDRTLIDFDKDQVTAITIESSEENISLKKEDEQWNLVLSDGKKIMADEGNVTSALNELSQIQPSRLVAKDKEKWAAYNVGDDATRVRVYQDETLLSDLIIGQPQMNGYVRKFDEEQVFASDGFTGLRGKNKIENFRFKTFVKQKADSIIRIQFNYQADSAFSLSIQNGQWNINDTMPADSNMVATFLRGFNLYTGTNLSKQDGTSLGALLAEIRVESKQEPELVISAFRDEQDSVVYHSNTNPDGYFTDASIGQKYFKTISDFVKNQ